MPFLPAQLLIPCLVATLAGAAAPAVPAGATPTMARPVAPAVGDEPFLADLAQLTFPDRFQRAGEAYFSPSGRWIIFQAIPAGATTSNYAMYVARLTRDTRTGLINGLEEITEVSPPNSATTCGWFHPTLPGVVLFGCAQGPLSDDQPPGYSRDRARYSWSFPREMEIVTRTVPAMVDQEVRDADMKFRILSRPDVAAAQPMWHQDGYNAEGSFSADGRVVLHTWMDPETGDADLYARIVETGEMRPLVTEEGYDGGPFFSPDGKWICYRSDRRGDNLLQVFVAELAFDDRGLPTGIAREVQLTDNGSVNWAPFWHPSGEYLIYTTSQVGHDNYEVFAMAFDAADPKATEPVRITDAAGFDGLPVFNARGSLMMWTAQRGQDVTASGHPSSQLWIARTTSTKPAGLGAAMTTTEAPTPPAGDSPGLGQMRVRFGIMPGNYDDTRTGIDVGGATPGGSAANAGIRTGDRLMTWNGTTITDIRHWMGLMMQHEPGDVVKVGVLRGGETIEIEVTLQAP
ncbi:MAG: PDZ domain-containing protein [Phycisphaerales bacterium]